MRYYDDGGVIAPEMDIDPEKGNAVNQWLAGQMGQRPGAAPMPPVATADQPAPREIQKPPEEKIADSHPALKASDIPPDAYTQYLKGEQGQIDKFGPEKQAEVMQNLQQSYKSPGNLIAKGGATLADAIMQGVARAGSSGNLAAINEREKANLDRTAEFGKGLQTQKLQAQGEKEKLEAMNATTPLGGTEAMAAQFLAKKLWPTATPEQLASISKNPQSLKSILPIGVDLEKALAEIANTQEFRMATLGLQKATLANTASHERAEENLTAENQKLQHPLLTRLAGLNGSTTPATGPLGQTTVKDGKTYEWSPVTGKYHLKK